HQVRERHRMAELLRAARSAGGRDDRGSQLRHDADRSALRQLRRTSRTRLSRRSASDRPALLYERCRDDVRTETLVACQRHWIEEGPMTRVDRPRLQHAAVVLAMAALATAAVAVAQQASLGYDDTPMQPNGKWHIHDGKRPQPLIVKPGFANFVSV